MKYFAVFLIAVIGLAAAAITGDYVPKAYFTIDENGNPSEAQPINSEVLNRVRRQIQPIQPFGQPGLGFQPFPSFAPPIGGRPGQSSFVSTSQVLSSRFGEDEPVVHGQSTIIHGHDGVFHQTHSVLRPDGTVHTDKKTGRVKRQTQSQLQSQEGAQGTQSQSQNQGQQGSDQFQSQTQGQNVAPNHVAPEQANQNIPQQPYTDNRGQGQSQQHIPQQPIHPTPADNRGQGQQHIPQGQGQQHIPQGQGQQHIPQGQGPQIYPQGGQPNYQQPGFGGAPFGFGAFQPGFMPGFGFQPAFFQPQPAFGFPAAGFAGGFPPVHPGQGTQTSFVGSTLDNRFGEEEPVVTGGTQTITSNNGVFHSTSSVLKPNGQVVTSHQSGRQPYFYG